MRVKAGIIFISIILLTACKAETLEEAIREDIPFNVNEVVHIESIKAGKIVLYKTEQKNQQGSFQALTVAFMKGDEESGWENAGHNHWEYDDNLNMTVYKDTFYDYNKKGDLKNKIPLIYGQIKNRRIQSIEVANADKKYKKAVVIHKDGNRYFLKIGNYSVARGLGKEGSVIEEQEERY